MKKEGEVKGKDKLSIRKRFWGGGRGSGGQKNRQKEKHRTFGKEKSSTDMNCRTAQREMELGRARG